MNFVGDSTSPHSSHQNSKSPVINVKNLSENTTVVTIKPKAREEGDHIKQKSPKKVDFITNPLKKLFKNFIFPPNENESIPSERAGNITLPQSGIDDASRFAKGNIAESDLSFTSIHTINHLNSRIQRTIDTSADSFIAAGDRIVITGADQMLNTDNIVIKTEQIFNKPNSFWPVSFSKDIDTITSPKKVVMDQSNTHSGGLSLEIKTKALGALPLSATFNPVGSKTLSASQALYKSTTSIMEKPPTNPKRRSLCMKFIFEGFEIVFFGFIIIVSSMALGFFGAVTSHSYDIVDYQVYGTAVIDGLLLRIYIITLISELAASSRTKDHLVLYTKLPWYHVWIFLQTTGVMLGLSFVFETKINKSIYSSVVYKGISVVLAMVVYYQYFRTKWRQVKHIKSQTSRKNKSFFYTEIYKQFLEELQQAGMKLKAPAASHLEEVANITRKPERRKSIAEAIVKRNNRWVQHSVQKTSNNKVVVIGSTQLFGIAALIFLPFVQLFIAFGIDRISVMLRDSFKTNICLVAIALYPIIIDYYPTFLEWINSSSKLNLGSNAIFLSIVFSTLPFRIFFLRATTLEQALYIIAIRLGYKVLVYLIYGIIWKCVRRLLIKAGKALAYECKALARKCRRTFLERSSGPKESKTTCKNLFEAEGAVSQSEKVQNIETLVIKFEALAIKFEILQICDIYNILVFWVILLCFYRLSNQVSNSFNLIKPEVYETIRISSTIELGCEMIFWVLVGLAWKISGNLNGRNIRTKMKEVLFEVKKVYFAANALLFYSFFLSLERYRYLDFT